jgi:hypothetical protein
MALERVLSMKHLGLKLAAAVVLDIAAALIINSRRVRAWCETIDAHCETFANITDDS